MRSYLGYHTKPLLESRCPTRRRLIIVVQGRTLFLKTREINLKFQSPWSSRILAYASRGLTMGYILAFEICRHKKIQILPTVIWGVARQFLKRCTVLAAWPGTLVFSAVFRNSVLRALDNVRRYSSADWYEDCVPIEINEERSDCADNIDLLWVHRFISRCRHLPGPAKNNPDGHHDAQKHHLLNVLVVFISTL